MSIFALSGVLIALTCGIVAVIVLLKSRNRLHFIWGAFLFAVAIWGFGDYFIANAENPESALFWWRFSYVGVILIPAFLFHFVQIFIREIKTKKIIANYIIALFFLTLNLTSSLFIDSVRFVFNELYYLSQPTILYNIFFIWFLFVFSYVLYKSFKSYKAESGLLKIQIKYFFYAILIAIFGGVFNFLPVYNIDIYPVLNFTLPIGASIIAYAILRYRFIDIRIVFKKSFIFTILVLTIIGIYALLAYIISIYLQNLIGTSSLILNGIVTAVLVAIGFEPLKNLLSKWTDSFLFKGSYNFQQLLSEINQTLNTSLNLRKILDTISRKLYNAFRATFFSIYLHNDEKSCFSEAAFVGKRIMEPRCLTLDEMVNYQKVLKKYSRIQNIIVTEELKKEYEIKPNKNLKQVIEELEKNGVSITIPVFLHNRPVAIFFVGPKKSGDYYSQQDLNLLKIIAAQSATAIENSSLYAEVKDLNKNLQKKVEEQTKDIVEKNKKLEQLLLIKSEFLDIASHQLRTPVSVICGILDMFKSGSMDKLPKEKQMEFIANAFAKGKKLNAVINDILDASDLDEKELDLSDSLSEINLSELVKNVIDYSSMEAKDKQIKIKTDIQNDVKVEGDNKYLEQAIGNLLDNAIKYTPAEKEIEISLKKQKNKAIFKIKDSGIGIPKKEQKNLFQKFTRASNAKEMHTDGSGLGLFIVKKVIDAHPGAKVWFESKKDQGTTFFIELESI